LGFKTALIPYNVIIMPFSTEFLRQTWVQALDRRSPQSMELFEQLCAAYQSQTRYYHTLEHLQQMLELLKTIQVHDRSSITLAIWFHDAIYDSQTNDNELKSAKWAIEALSPLGLSSVKIDRIVQLILMTKTHQVDSDDREAQALLDCDLSILGAAAEDYRRYAQAIRQEYAWVSDQDYRIGRSRVLQAFLDRDRIYHLPEHEPYEHLARQNLTTELHHLAPKYNPS
jgi:predicted metal-dependent HD superfamily phosphohydrolase